MSTKSRRFERDGHSYELHVIEDDPIWHLYENFDTETALVGSVTQRGSQFSIECYWKPEPGARNHAIDATTVDEAVTALLDLAGGADPRAA